MLKAFIVDDSNLVRERLTAMVTEHSGLQVIGHASRASEAVEAIDRLRPDVVILDIRLAEGNGIDVLEVIRARDVPAKVIMLTSFPYPQYRSRCEAAGADYFFDKLNEFDAVSRAISQIIESLKPGNPTDTEYTER